MNSRELHPGNLTERYELRKRLNCKSMDWYINNVYPELKTQPLQLPLRGTDLRPPAEPPQTPRTRVEMSAVRIPSVAELLRTHSVAHLLEL